MTRRVPLALISLRRGHVDPEIVKIWIDSEIYEPSHLTLKLFRPRQMSQLLL